ncbi:MAG TPA: FKBP-type peptidyl-prolyl cis-trans isomerase [Opitutaceae bacterium]|nr:FKBP-type peptidyl-prolyl cis-trans isomerase [Opitutaceae bacterium]
MNRIHLILACLLSLGASAVLSAQDVKVNIPGQTAAPAASATPAAAAPAFTEPQLLEVYGWWVGKQLGLFEQGFTKEQIDTVVKGLLVAAAGKNAPYDMELAGPQMDAFMRGKQAAYLTKLRQENLAEAKSFFEKLKDNKNVVELPSGLRYEVVRPGAGAYPKATDTVKVHYTGTLLNGTVFDSSVQRNEPAEFALNQVIAGWSEGLQKINQGGKIRLYVPSQLAYGDSGNQNIPPGAALIFDVDLLEIKGAPAAAPVSKP